MSYLPPPYGKKKTSFGKQDLMIIIGILLFSATFAYLFLYLFTGGMPL